MSTINRDAVRQTILDALSSVAPEADLASLDPKAALRETLDLDSMDFLNFVIALHKALGTDVPERDYAKLATLESCVEYLVTHGR